MEQIQGGVFGLEQRFSCREGHPGTSFGEAWGEFSP